MTDPQPSVSVIIPCRNEERTIALVLDALDRQTFPSARMEIIIADGYSTDDTRNRIRTFAEVHPNMKIRLIDNPGLTAPAALNAGLRVATGTIVARMDAHAVPYPDYLERSVRTLEETGCEAVGGMWDVQPGAPGIVGLAIAAAITSPFATGGVRYRVGGKPGEVDNVPFGAFRRGLFDRVGNFNEQVPVNEDYEFFYRVRAAGGRVYFSPDIRSRYIARANIRSLARQYFYYGHQKAVMLSFHPRSIRIRQMIPALFAPSLVVLAIGSFFFLSMAIVLGIELAAYGAANAAFSIREALKRNTPGLAAVLPWVFVCIHIPWGMGFWIGTMENFGRFFHNIMGGKKAAG